MKGQNLAYRTVKATKPELSKAELREQGLRVLGGIIVRCHLEKSLDSEVENATTATREFLIQEKRERWTRRRKRSSIT